MLQELSEKAARGVLEYGDTSCAWVTPVEERLVGVGRNAKLQLYVLSRMGIVRI